jgi:cell wall-associated NlpC family hydrolase
VQQHSDVTALAAAGGDVVSIARSQAGVPYRYGGVSPKTGFDCSGLILWAYRQRGVAVPRLAKAQAAFGTPVDIRSLHPGDIVAFRIKGGYHTGIYSGNGNFIHSPSTGSRVREESLHTAYWRSSFIGARRVL